LWLLTPLFVRYDQPIQTIPKSSIAMTDYNITTTMTTVEVLHLGKLVTIQREENPSAIIRAEYAITARICPPYCIQPMQLAEGVETLGELEVLDCLMRIRQGESKLMLVDSRTQDWFAKGTIPGAVNIPYAQNMAGEATDLPRVKKTLLELFGVKESGGTYDFSVAHTLAIFCNGPWCGQTPNHIRTLLALGYPATRLKWYRGGMQDWCSMGLPSSELVSQDALLSGSGLTFDTRSRKTEGLYLFRDSYLQVLPYPALP
jgi:rhodanese-related sulfurtransferase